MTLPTVQIDALFTDPQGRPYRGAELVIRMDRDEVYNGMVIPSRLVYELDDEGRAELHLWPNDLGSSGSQYIVELYRGRSLVFEAEAVFPSAGGPLTLHDYIRLRPHPEKSTVERLAENIRRYAADASNAIRNAMAIHKAEPDPHTQYVLRSEVGDGGLGGSGRYATRLSLNGDTAVLTYDDGTTQTLTLDGHLDGGTF